MRRLRSKLGMLAVVVLAGSLLAACGQQEDAPEDEAQETVVDVTLDEWAIGTSSAQGPAGSITFEIENTGEDTHEFVIIRTDLGMLDLPVDDEGAVDEEGEDIEVVDEVEDIGSGSSESLTVELDAGRYVFICNIVEDEDEGETEVHYHLGMRNMFEVV